ncbi:MAG: sulfatase-like hydrolase/transferase, partial [Candidatus Omnitrophica bacterium]|nr:sulfatase-like hydrolase/transferase [Candidatus Omnitrophota bacterium]
MKKIPVIHPFLFAVYPILFLFNFNKAQVPYHEMAAPIIISLLMTGFALGFFTAILKNIQKAALITTGFLFLFFSYGHVHKKIWYQETHVLLLGVWLVLLLIVILAVSKLRKPTDTITQFLNVMTIVLIVMSGYDILRYETALHKALRSADKTEAEKSVSLNLTIPDPAPDIYHIVLDGYASPSALETIYKYDNTPFYAFLKQNGFQVFEHNTTNYAVSFLSFASFLNMKYLNYLTDIEGKQSKNRRIPYEMIKNNPVMLKLKEHGYVFFHFSSGWGPTNSNKHADGDYCGGAFGVNEFRLVLIQTTLLRPFQHMLSSTMRERILCSFATIQSLSSTKEPKYVFAHFLAPHPPYVFDQDGDPVEESALELEGDTWSDNQKYLDQLTYMTKRTEEMITAILANASRPVVIWVHSDHGSEATFHNMQNDVWGGNAGAESFQERMKIFSTIHIPKEYSVNIPDGHSLV